MALECNIPVAFALLLGSATTGWAQQYSFRHYGAAEGLENLVVLSLAQDHDGYIWAGSEGGLYRYDGTRFRLMGLERGLPCATEVHTIYTAKDGALWINACSEIYRFDGARFQAIPGLSGALSGAERIAEGLDGKVVVSTTSGLEEVWASGGTFHLKPYPVPAALAGKATQGILRHGSELWFGCDWGLCVEQGGQVSRFGSESGLPKDSWDGIAASPDGTIWVRSPNRLYKKPVGQERLVEEKLAFGSSMFWGAVTISGDGSPMVPTDRGLAIRSVAGWSVLDQRRGLRSPMASAALEDRQGSLWIGLIGGGVERRLGGRSWEAWTVAQGLPSDLIWNIRRGRMGDLWVATSAGVARLDGRSPMTTWSTGDGLGGDNIRWLGETSEGSIWALAKPGGLARYLPAIGKFRPIGREDLNCGLLYRGFVDRLDRLWLATSCGVFLNERPERSDRFVRIAQPELLQRGAWAVLMDRQDALWVTGPAGLWRMRDGVWRHYSKAEGLLSDDPYIPILAPDGSLWLRHRMDAGIERVEVSGDRIVRTEAIVAADRRSTEVTAFHGFDSQGNFWRGGANGVAILRGHQWIRMSIEDGLIWNDCDGEAFWADGDGSVWVGTSGGLGHYMSGGLPPIPLTADPMITALEISQRPRVARAEFSSLNYQLEQLVHFAYRLDDGPWTDIPERAVSFAGLAPGSHRLETRSRVRDGPASDKIAVENFRAAPFWWETWWLRGLGLLVAAAGAWGAVRWRQRLLESRNHELELAVRRRTAELEAERARVLEEKRRADDANRAKGIFLAHMSHELRTPLSGVIGLAGLLADMALPSEALETVQVIRSSADTLLRVINDILDFSKIEAGKLELETAPFALRRPLEGAMETFRAVAAAKGLRLAAVIAPELPEWVAGDCTRLSQVVLNLISNAVKFTHAGGVTLSAALERHDAESCHVAIEVRDTGIGIAPHQLSRIFSSFSQADASISRLYGGTGLGLAISKRLVELMGGALEVESQLGEGAVFRFSIPLAPAEEPAPVESGVTPIPHAGSLKVLVAEDNPVIQRVMRALLEKLGVRADLVGDGASAIAAVSQGHYDVLLMDVQMPAVDGLEATRMIRADPDCHQPAIYGLTACTTEEYRDICLGAGMNGYLTKPVEPERLRGVLAGCCARQEQEQLV